MAKIEPFTEIVNGKKPLIIFAKRSVLDVLPGSEYAFIFQFMMTYAEIGYHDRPEYIFKFRMPKKTSL